MIGILCARSATRPPTAQGGSVASLHPHPAPAPRAIGVSHASSPDAKWCRYRRSHQVRAARLWQRVRSGPCAEPVVCCLPGARGGPAAGHEVCHTVALHRLADIVGASVSEAAMRPNPRSASATARRPSCGPRPGCLPKGSLRVPQNPLGAPSRTGAAP
jgi:hypothetical protein